MMAILLDVSPGDEVILPSFTFVSTATAFCLRGATLRFADCDDSGNILYSEVERLLSPRTKAVVAVHYAGNSCDLAPLAALCAKSGVLLLEDAAQALGSHYLDRPLGTIGALSAISFHDTKNVSSGEGGALVFGPGGLSLLDRARIVREKGTNRAAFLSGRVDKYSWVELGSSYVLSELNAAYLEPQLGKLQELTAHRRALWDRYRTELSAPLARAGVGILERPNWNSGNGHIFGLLFEDLSLRDDFSRSLGALGISCTSHFQPLHRSPFMASWLESQGRVPEFLPGTERLSAGILRLPLDRRLSASEQDRVIGAVQSWLKRTC
jgi:dTDP-4-amino-4,6-dideoxygalactose transaminase